MNSTSDKITFFIHELTVSEKDTDQNGHVNNVVYVQWMQDIAIMHSEKSGGIKAAEEADCTWVVRSHKVEYLHPAFSGEVIEAATWVDNFRRVRSLRRYSFSRKSDGILLARGETEWVFIDNQKGKPCTIPEKVRKCYPVAKQS